MHRNGSKTVIEPPAGLGQPWTGLAAGASSLGRGEIDALFSATYEELRRLAAGVRRGDPSATLTPTALVNEAWLKLARSHKGLEPGRTAATRS